MIIIISTSLSLRMADDEDFVVGLVVDCLLALLLVERLRILPPFFDRFLFLIFDFFVFVVSGGGVMTTKSLAAAFDDSTRLLSLIID